MPRLRLAQAGEKDGWDGRVRFFQPCLRFAHRIFGGTLQKAVCEKGKRFAVVWRFTAEVDLLRQKEPHCKNGKAHKFEAVPRIDLISRRCEFFVKKPSYQQGLPQRP